MVDKASPKAPPANPKEGYFLSDVKELRRRARQHIEDGAITSSYKADRPKVVKVLNEALATEIVCILRYKRHYFMATGIHANAVAARPIAPRSRWRSSRPTARSAAAFPARSSSIGRFTMSHISSMTTRATCARCSTSTPPASRRSGSRRTR